MQLVPESVGAVSLRHVSILIRPEGRMQRTGIGGNAHDTGSFNPHPARRPDATLEAATDNLRTANVSILIRAEGRMQPSRPRTGLHARGVSILIRPEGRMQRRTHRDFWNHLHLVSILIRPEGRMQQFRSPGLTQFFALVSILIRPEGRMQPMQPLTQEAVTFEFQSSSGQKAGCNSR